MKTMLNPFGRRHPFAFVLLLGVGLAALAVASAASASSPAPAGASSRGDANRGKAVYAQYCASCHGVRGDGKGPAGLALNPHPTNFRDAERMSKLTDDTLFRAIRDGGSAVGKSALMPAWKGTLSDAQIRDVIAYVRTFSANAATKK